MTEILGVDALTRKAVVARGGARDGILVALGCLEKTPQGFASTHLVSAWRMTADRKLEITLPFELIRLSLDRGELLGSERVRAKDLGLVPGRELPGEIDDYLPTSKPEDRDGALTAVRADTARIWQLFCDARTALSPAQREVVRAYERARRIGLMVRDLVFQEALYPDYDAWLKAA